MNRVWYLTELEQGFLLEVHSEVNRGQLSQFIERHAVEDRKSTRLNSSHGYISYAVFCLKKKKNLAVPRGKTLQHPTPRLTPGAVLAASDDRRARSERGCSGSSVRTVCAASAALRATRRP